jgi:hypothetical protein
VRSKRAIYVHIHDGSNPIVTEAEAATLSPAADMGAYPVGSDCYRDPRVRKLVEPYVQPIPPRGQGIADLSEGEQVILRKLARDRGRSIGILADQARSTASYQRVRGMTMCLASSGAA